MGSVDVAPWLSRTGSVVQPMGLVTRRHMEASQTRELTRGPRIGRQSLIPAPQGKASASSRASSDHLVLVCLELPCFSRGTPISSPVLGKPGQLATLILDHATQTPGKGTTLPQLEMPYIPLPYVLMGNQCPEPREAFPLLPKSCPRGDPRQSCIVNELNSIVPAEP